MLEHGAGVALHDAVEDARRGWSLVGQGRLGVEHLSAKCL